jgi:hypothetical protein
MGYVPQWPIYRARYQTAQWLLDLRNDVGLLSEEYEPAGRRLVGNFPQAFSHLALVNTASNLSHDRKPAEQRSQRPVADKPPEETA